jgi:hypothetical protein
MAPRKATSTTTPLTAKAVGPATPIEARPSRGLPDAVKFPLVVLLAFSFTSILYQIASLFFGTELGSVSRRNPTTLQAVGFQLFRIFEFGVEWYLGYDGNTPRERVYVMMD